jgi:exodeoxyribonuclease VII small subunit
MAKSKKEPTFEKNLESLEGIVGALEEGGLTLEQSLKQFEEGVRLAGLCEKTLTAAEKKIEKLTKTASGEFKTEAFGDETAEEGEDDEEEEDGEESEEDDELLF